MTMGHSKRPRLIVSVDARLQMIKTFQCEWRINSDEAIVSFFQVHLGYQIGINRISIV